MKIKTFTAAGSMEAMSQAREALGDEAVIISTETLDDGQVRVTAAVDEAEEISFNDNQELEVCDNPARYTDRLLRESLEYHDTLDLVKQRILAAVRKLSAEKKIYDDRRLLELALEQLYGFSDILNLQTPCKIFMGAPGQRQIDGYCQNGSSGQNEKNSLLHCFDR